MRFTLALCLALWFGSAVSAQNAPTAANAVTPLHWLVGGAWTADASALGSGMQRIETRYTPSDNGAFLRFTTHFISTQGVFKNYDGQFFFDTATHGLRFWYTDAAGAITSGPLTADGDHLRFTFTGPDFAGKTADLAVDVLHRDGDRYTWTLKEKTGEAWKTLAELTYIRKTE